MYKALHTFNGLIKVFLGIILLFGGLIACRTETEGTLTLTNPAALDRLGARVIISRDSLDKYYPDLTGHSFLIKDTNGNNIAYQLDDMSSNGEWDELALLCSLEASKKKKLHFQSVKKEDIPSFTDRANIWFARFDSSTQKYQTITREVRPDWYHRMFKTPFYYQFEGPGWENDRIGFRLYFDERNGFDIWGKQTSKMVLKDVGLKGDNYHALSAWGMDVLHVGNTLGAGGIAVIENDSLFHLGATDKAEFKQITDGPIRAVFDLIYRGWHLGDKTYSIRERISIWGGQQGYSNKVSLLTDHAKTTLAAGIVTAKLPGKPEFQANGQPFPYVAGWGHQSEHNDDLGMAVVGPSDAFAGYGQRHSNPAGVDSSAFLKYKLTADHPVQYAFVTGWEVGNKDFAKKEYFIKTVRDEGKRLSNPVEVSF